MGRLLLGSRACVRRWAAAARPRGAARRVQGLRAAAAAARALHAWRQLCPSTHDPKRRAVLMAAAASVSAARAAAGALVRLRAHAARRRHRSAACAAARELLSRRACRARLRAWAGAPRRRALGALGVADRQAATQAEPEPEPSNPHT